MTNNSETVEKVCEEFRTPEYTCKNCDFKICPSINMFSDRVLAAHKREIADEKRISDAVIKSLRDKKLEMAGEIAAKDAEIARLRALVKGLLDASSISCADCKYDCYSDHSNCIIHDAANYIKEIEVKNGER